MGILCIILASLLTVSSVLIFLLWRVLKNTYCTMRKLQIQEELNSDTAYDGQYYPGSVIAVFKYDCEEDMIVTDFAQYEEKKLIGITILSRDPYPEEDFAPLGITREEAERPHLFHNVTVFQPREGFWKWK